MSIHIDSKSDKSRSETSRVKKLNGPICGPTGLDKTMARIMYTTVNVDAYVRVSLTQFSSEILKNALVDDDQNAN